MYAIIELGGRQWKVEPGTQFDINRVPTAVGAQHLVERVLFAHDGNQLQVGRPYLTGVKVVCEVVDHRLGPKEISYHFRRRENWRKTVGHRQPLSRLVVKDIVLDGTSAAAAEPVKAAAKTSTAEKKSTAGKKGAAKTAAVKKPRSPKAAGS